MTLRPWICLAVGLAIACLLSFATTKLFDLTSDNAALVGVAFGLVLVNGGFILGCVWEVRNRGW